MTAPRRLIYEIFVDRFAGEDGRALAPPAGEPWLAHAGGQLGGIAARLPHLLALGVDALYLTPIFRAPSNHKYDTESYDEIDPRFGGEAGFARLVAALEQAGLGLFLDGVFNHVGRSHPWFRAAERDPADPHARLFRFERHPDRYACWRGFDGLPELALDEPEVRRRLFAAEDSVLRRWLGRGATGWRLDCANDLGLSACAEIQRAAAGRAADGVIGEVMGYAEAYLTEGRLDGVMNYVFRESVLSLVEGKISALQALDNLARLWGAYPRAASLRSWNALSTHDTPRLATLVPDARARRLAWTLAFTAPGVPLVYYGEEIGMRGGPDPANRAIMCWEEAAWDHATLALLRRLSALRGAHPALLGGAFLPCPQLGAPQLLSFIRHTDDPGETVVILANGSAEPLSARAFLPYSFLPDALPLQELLGVSAVLVMRSGRVDVALDPFEVRVLAPDDTRYPGYRFLRGRR